LSIIAVGELQHAAVGLGDLAAQDQTNAAAAELGGEERNNKIVAVEQAGPLNVLSNLLVVLNRGKLLLSFGNC